MSSYVWISLTSAPAAGTKRHIIGVSLGLTEDWRPA